MSELVIVNRTFESVEYKDFMAQWAEEIEQFFPHFSDDDVLYGEIYLLRYSTRVIGVFIFQDKGEELHVDVHFVIPEYRGMGIGKQFFVEKLEEFKKMGFSTVVALASDADRINYLIGCGFKNSRKHPDWYELELK